MNLVLVRAKNGSAESANDGSPGLPVEGDIAEPGGGLHVALVAVFMSATLAPPPQREQIPAAGLLRCTCRCWSTRKQKNTISRFFGGEMKC
ncbi:hypothetical protein glysoja_037959 [Glycine soja]|uniref:Uncharacterized protein n=1 Tax=Glycine soja TaxID=3848 RepID=A0A0B2P9R3_GLYSO|nr:hypothetical protein glysoja_037959 [Glycine soja]